MAITPELQAIYTGEADLDVWEGLVLSHPRAGTRYLANTASAVSGEVDGAVRTFEPVPFVAVLPDRDAEGRQDLRLQICALGGEVRALLNAAIADPTTPVSCRYGVWIYGDTALQSGALLALNLTNIVLTMDGVACIASRADILNKSIPAQLYRIDTDPGLDRR